MQSTVLQNATGPVAIRLTNDYLFKTLLQENDLVLKSLICSLLHLEQDQIKSAVITNPILPGERITDKIIILDINVIFNNDRYINLEMQVVNEHNWTERATFYACRNFTKQNKGTKYSVIKPVFQIGFLDFTLFPEHPSFYSTYRFSDIVKHYEFTDKLTIAVVDLTNIALATDDDRKYNIDKWAKLFKAQSWEDIKMIAAQDINISSAAATLYQLSEDERIQQECEAREDYLLREQDLADRITERDKAIAERDKEISIRNKAIAEKDRVLAERDRVLAERDQTLAERNQTLAAQQQEIDRLKALLAEKK